MTIYNDAKDGTLNEVTIREYTRAGNDINGQSTQIGDGTKDLTPLCLAVRHGHVGVVRDLLSNDAKPDAPSKQGSTPLWLATARGKINRLEIVQLLLRYGADAKHAHAGSTPLENELKQHKDVEVIELLVNKGGITATAEDLARNLDTPEISDAMQSTERRSELRNQIVNLIVAFVLFVIAWVNSPTLTGVTNRIFDKFQIKGNKDSEIAKQIAEEIPEPQTKEDFKKSATEFIDKHKLGKFFSADDDDVLETLVSKAVDIQNDDTSVLGQAANAKELVNYGLYQPILYCDDSGSMDKRYNSQNEDRWASLTDLALRITNIGNQIRVNDGGIHVRFINREMPTANLLRGEDDIRHVLGQIEPGGPTEIGVNLRKQILDPFVYQKKMERPLLISIITDGVPGGPDGSSERRHTLKKEILQCNKWLEKNKYPPAAVKFQISQIGSDPAAKAFLDDLANDDDLKSVWVTAQQLDEKFQELRTNERELDTWLIKTLILPFKMSE